MKHRFLLSLVLIGMMLPQVVSAYDLEVGGVYYNFQGTDASGRTKLTVTCKSATENDYGAYTDGTVSIPSEFTLYGDDFIVTAIADEAFRGCTELKNVVFPKTLQTIGDEIFKGCDYLESIRMEGPGVKYDSRGNCNALIETATNTLVLGCQNSKVPASVTAIGSCAFYGCRALIEFVIPDHVTTIGDCAFCMCSNLKKVTIGSGVTTIDPLAFYECTLLSDVTNLATEPQNIHNDDFSKFGTLHVLAGCKEAYAEAQVWKKFTIAEDATESTRIMVDGLYYTIVSETNARVISGDAEYEGNITIPATVNLKGKTYNVTSIGDNAFENCAGLTAITLPSSLVAIRSHAFASCTGLTAITLPASVTTLKDNVFIYCNGLLAINVEKGNTVYDSRENCNAIIETATNTLITGCRATNIPTSVTAFGNYAFESCTGLTAINFSKNVIAIGEGAFEGCDGLTTLFIPKGITRINKNAFAGCSGLKSIVVENSNPNYDSRENCNAIIETATGTLITGCCETKIPSGATKIGDFAFCRTNLSYIYIPDGVTVIGMGAFFECKNLKELVLGRDVTKLEIGAFTSCPNIQIVYAYPEMPPTCELIPFDVSIFADATLLVSESECDTIAYRYRDHELWGRFANIEVGDLTGVTASHTATLIATPAHTFNLAGQRTDDRQRGIIIRKDADGTARKMLKR